MNERDDWSDRRKLVTVHHPVDLAFFVAIQQALSEFIPGDTPFGDIYEETDDGFAFYAARADSVGEQQ